MKESEDWSQNMNEVPLPPSPDAERVQQQEQWAGYGPNGYPVSSQQRKGKKSKWVAGLLAFLVPGIGHMYLGLMVKGIVLMLLVALDITAIVFASMEIDNVLSIVLLSLLMPIIYFYNLFDAIQSTDAVNERNDSMGTLGGFGGGGAGSGFVPPAPQMSSSSPQPPTEGRGLPPIGVVLLAGAGVVFLLMSGTDWTHRLFNSAGSMFGAVVLIAAGVALWFWESRGHQRKGN